MWFPFLWISGGTPFSDLQWLVSRKQRGYTERLPSFIPSAIIAVCALDLTRGKLVRTGETYMYTLVV